MPFASIEPHPVALPLTVQVGRAAKALGVVGVVVVGMDCVRDQVTPWFLRSLVRMAKKGCFSLVGTAAVVGLSEMLTPDWMVSWIVPVPFELASATDWTVTVRTSRGKVVGSGSFDGARNVAVAGLVVCSLESVPNEPSVGQTLAAAVTGAPEELVVVVV